MKRWITWLSLGIMFFVGIYAAVIMGNMSRTYNGENATVSVYELQQDPAAYDDSTADGAAAVIVQQNLEETHAVNNVTSVVFDFRGYDTMGESFILILTISGIMVLLKKTAAEKEQMKKEREERNGK